MSTPASCREHRRRIEGFDRLEGRIRANNIDLDIEIEDEDLDLNS